MFGGAMRKGGLATILLFGLLVPAQQQVARAQVVAPPSVGVCAGGPIPSTPMPGHYTGTWHSDGDYKFTAFNTVIDLQVTIDGTLDATVTADGGVTGTVTGHVDAPVTHDGIKDISSGTGTFRANVQGVFNPAG